MKRYFLTIVMIAALMYSGGQLWAQKEISSTVSDFLTFAPIESANIYIQNSTIGTISNVDGKFVLQVPEEYVSDTLVISSIGYKSFKMPIDEFDGNEGVFLEEDIAALDEVVVTAETRPDTGNGVVLKALEELEDNLPENAYLQKGFLRHKERNKKEYRWLIESAFTVYDSSYATSPNKYLKINIDEIRKSYDLRDVDSLFAYYSFLKYNARNVDLKSKSLDRDTIDTRSLVEAIRWNDRRVNGLGQLLRGKLNLLRNSQLGSALFGEDILERHQFKIDTVLVDDGRKLYKIRIQGGPEFVGLDTENIYNEGFEAKGWLYIYWDNYAFKRIEYELVAASDVQKRRSRDLFGTLLNHKLIITYKEYNDKMYPNYIFYETPKLVKIDRSREMEARGKEVTLDRDRQYYYTIQELLFTEIIEDPLQVQAALNQSWDEDLFVPRPYNESFWKTYNVLLESREEEKLIKDLTKRAGLFQR
jgi:hypothetical protein